MTKLKINFQLQELDKIAPFGEAPALSLHWFGLTDGLLWIDVGRQTIYEYTQEAQNYFGRNIPYNDYQLSRFLEDFFYTFGYISESVPSRFYNSIEDFYSTAIKWKESHFDDDDDTFDRFYDEKYEPLTDWYHDRSFDSGYLVGGPYIGCFRHNDRIKILWESEYKLEDGNNLWTSPKGVFELYYEDFVQAVNEFLDSFFAAMGKQVEMALAKDWGEISLDKKRLVTEHEERKETFYHQLSYLKKQSAEKTDWQRIIGIADEMQKIR